MRVLLLDDIEAILKELGLSPLREEDMLVLLIGEGGREVVVYIIAEEERKVAYVLASAYPPIKAEGRELDILRASWELVDRGVPCKVGVDKDSVVVEVDLDECHIKKDVLLESIYFAAEGMLTIADKLREGESPEAAEGESDT